MEIIDNEIPLVVILGPTASGKTRLAIEVAKKFNGEIICADSRTVYKEINIATAKPSLAEQDGVKHWALGIVDVNKRFTVSEFKEYADKKIDEIRKRGHVPFLVGGTGLYADAVMFDYEFGSNVDEKLRTKLQHMSLQELYDYCKEYKINLPENFKNKRYVIRNIENHGIEKSSQKTLKYKSIVVGITTPKDSLMNNIQTRIEQQLENGVIDEAIELSKKYGWKLEAMKSNIYRIIQLYLNNEITLDDLKERSATLDWRLAKRQLTWLRRNSFIQWMDLKNANKYLLEQLAIYKK